MNDKELVAKVFMVLQKNQIIVAEYLYISNGY